MHWLNTEVSARTGMRVCAHMCVVSENVWASSMFVCVVRVCIVSVCGMYILSICFVCDFVTSCMFNFLCLFIYSFIYVFI